MDRETRRNLREAKIKRRKNIFKSLNHWSDDIPVEEGYFENGNYLNGINGGLCKKTNWKKRHSHYRRKHGYGKGMDYKPHDQRQIDKESDQEEEVFLDGDTTR